MAQVRKMNNGGSVQKLKYGSIIKNGTKYEMDEETFQLYLKYHFATCERQDMIGASSHTVDILSVNKA